jgi:hypothetical protein
VTRRVAERASGHPGRPLSAEARVAKLRACHAHAGEPLPSGAAEQLVDVIGRFDHLTSTSELTGLLIGTSA